VDVISVEPLVRMLLYEGCLLYPYRTGMDTHALHPLRVLRMIQAAGANLLRIWLVGCEPATFNPEEGRMGLSEPVKAAVPEAIALVHSLLARIWAHEQRRSGDGGGALHL
jgi:Ni,Fe-hydrogenase maturation factor